MARPTPIPYKSLFHNLSEPRYLKQAIKLSTAVHFPSLDSPDGNSMIFAVDAAMLSISGFIGDEISDAVHN